MRTIIAGSRDEVLLSHISSAVDLCGWAPTTVISGTARGVDRLGEEWAKANGVPVEKHPANWGLHGKSAGYKRNVEMAECADALIAIWDGKSRGTKHMIDIASRKGLRICVYGI